MGNSVSWLSGLLFAKKEIRILILGLVCCCDFPTVYTAMANKSRTTQERRRFFTG